MLIGYPRVLTQDQRLDLQRNALLNASCGKHMQRKNKRRPVGTSGINGCFRDVARGGYFVRVFL